MVLSQEPISLKSYSSVPFYSAPSQNTKTVQRSSQLDLNSNSKHVSTNKICNLKYILQPKSGTPCYTCIYEYLAIAAVSDWKANGIWEQI